MLKRGTVMGAVREIRANLCQEIGCGGEPVSRITQILADLEHHRADDPEESLREAVRIAQQARGVSH